MVRTRTQDYLDLYVFTPGRRAWAAKQLKDSAAQAGLVDLAGRAGATLDGDTQLVSDFQKWDVTKVDAEGHETSSAVVGADQRRDRSLGGLFREVQNKGELDDAAIAQAALTISRRVFPTGAEPIVNAPFVEETALVNNALSLLEGELASAVGAAGVSVWVKQVRTHNDAFAALYGKLTADRAGLWDKLKERDRAGQEAFADLVVQALAASEKNATLRASLLAEVERQQDELRDLYRRRGGGRVPDVDPTTGATTPTPQPTPNA